MPLFAYKIVDANGKEKKGTIESPNKAAVKTKFLSEGYYITEISEKSGAQGFSLDFLRKMFSFGAKKVPLDEVASMTRLLATLQKAKIPLVEAIDAVAQQQENPIMKDALIIIKGKMNEGYSFSKSAREFPNIFDDLFCNMIAAGEESGATDKVLMRLAGFMESQVDLKNKVKSAMTYPIVLMIVAILVVGVLFTVVIPKLSKMFEDVKMSLPIQTKILLWLSGFIGSWWWLIALMIFGGIVAFNKYVKTPKGEIWWSRVKINAPVLGRVNRQVAISRFAQTLSTLLHSGVPILNALDIVKKIIDNKILENAVGVARENIKEGESIALPLKRSGEFPPIVIQMIAIGEQSGELEEMLETLANSYEKEVTYTMEKLTSMLEPMMIVALAGVIGFIVFSVVMPILQLNDAVG
ncbi:type II secretion system F family protein [bacterium]|nr:type II secretion system F family protein [bacterium]MBQ4439033.1 type II secretion system F family protein [bacterium]